MKGNINNKLLLIFAILAGSYCHQADATQSTVHSNQLRPSTKPLKALPEQYIVQLTTPSVSRHIQQKYKGALMLRDKPLEAVQYRKKLSAIQQRMSAQILRTVPGVTIYKRFDTLVNALAVTANKTQIQQIRQFSGVANVWPVTTHYLSMDASHALIDTPAAWSLATGQHQAGQNVKIAIVDTGIRNDNPMFASASITALDMSGNQYLQQNPDHCRRADGDQQFCNNKVVVARWIDPAAHGVQVYQNEHLSPLDFNGHGSHVAGIAAGNAVDITYKGQQMQISGVAPGSYLMVYKALYTGPDGNGFATDTMLLEALEHAVNDGADIINNSWGSLSTMPQDSVFNTAITNAELNGIVVVNAAGNDIHAGQGSTINCPACIESGIAVANTTHGRFFGNRIMMSGQIFFGYQGNDNQLNVDQTLPLHKLESPDPFISSGCAPIVDINLQGKAVLIDYRNLCSFSEVANNIKAAGGLLVLAYQGEHPDTNTYEPLYTLEANPALPVLGVTQLTGLSLSENSGSDITISAAIEPHVESQFADKLHPFSATGPNKDAGFIKPDIAAPGTNILSALSPDEFVPIGLPIGGKSAKTSTVRFGMMTGTSMSSPHVAGAAAIIKQLNPEFNATQIKSTLTSLSNPNVFNGAAPATPHDIGSGRLDLSQLDKIGLAFSKVSMSNPSCIGQCEFTVTVTNLSDTQQQWQTQLSFMDENTLGQVSSKQLKLDAGQSHQLTVLVDVTRSQARHWTFGQLKFVHSQLATQHLPIAVFANDSDDIGIVGITFDGNTTTTDSPLDFTSFVRNKNIEENVTATIQLPENATLVENSQSANVHYGQTQQLNYNESDHILTWQGQLNKSSLNLQPVEPLLLTTLQEQGVEPVPCSQGCIGFSATIAFHFKYIGRDYEAITLSDNGFALPGEHNIDRWSALFNQQLPNPAPLNNIIAPLWTEFDLADPDDENDHGGGHLRVKEQQLNGKNYLVAEWADVEIYNLDDYLDGEDNQHNRDAIDWHDLQYTFQLIIEQDSDNIWFNYLKMPQLPPEATIGAENIDGSTGVDLYFDGQASPLPLPLPTEGYSLKLVSSPEGIVTIDYQLLLSDSNQSFAQADTFTGIEDEAILLDVLANDNAYTYVTVDMQVHAGNDFAATKTLKLNAEEGLDTSALAIVEAPSHGSISISEGKIHYLPSENFNGNDKLTYRIADKTGKSSQAVVNVTINEVNDPPMIANINDSVAFEQQQITIEAQVEDIDNDNLVILWQQTTGPTANWSQDGAKLSLTTPSVNKNTLLTFEISAKDEHSTTIQTAKVMVAPRQDVGGSLWLVLPLLLLAGWRRRVAEGLRPKI